MKTASYWSLAYAVVSVGVAGAIVAACSSSDEETVLPRAELLDPAKCGSCHTEHYREWQGSMHAYASDDPVFLAMNARLQRETGGALKDFCVKCHAPIALAEGLTKDGLNLAEVPKALKGISCYFCHNVDKVEDTHNNPLVLANDSTMRGPFKNPVKNGVHKSVYSSFIAGDRTDSAKTCGSCHDIVSPAGAHIERTFAEWQGSVFSKETDPKNPALPTGSTCVQCHMTVGTTKGPVAPGGVTRERHAHTFAAIDVAVTPWPEMEAQKAEINELLQVRTLQTALCIGQLGGSSQVEVVMHNLGVGHSFPSGASSDRRVWLEVVAYQGDKVIYESGTKLYENPTVDPARKIELIAEDKDPDLLLFRDCHFDKEGKPTELFGHAADVVSRQLEANTTFLQTDPAYYKVNMVRRFPYDSNKIITGVPDRVTLRTFVMPIGLEVLDDLVKSNDLDPAIVSRIPTFQVGETVEWTPALAEAANLSYRDLSAGDNYRCVTSSNATGIVIADKTRIVKNDRCR